MGAIKRRARRQRSKEHAEKALYYCLLFMYLFWEITTYQTIYGIVVILLVSFWMTLEQQSVKRTKIKLYRFNICDAVYFFSYRKIFFFQINVLQHEPHKMLLASKWKTIKDK